MKDIAPHQAPETNSDRTAKQPSPFFLAVALTAILYFSGASRVPNTTDSLSKTIPESAKFSAGVANAVLQEVSDRSQLPTSALRIVRAEPHTWPDECLGLQDSDGFCTRTQVPGWQVSVVVGQQRWVYRTNASGSVVKLHEATVSPTNVRQIVSLLP